MIDHRGLGCALALAALGATGAYAQQYPSKPIRIVVPFAPGGPNDILARMAGQKFTEKWKQQVIVDNRAGGGTVIGTELVTRAAPDGYTLLMASSSTASNVTLRKSLPYDTLRDLAPVTRIANSPNVLVVHPSLPARSVGDLLRLAKAKPGEITYGSGGVGAATHLAGELLSIMGGVRMTHIPYKGAGPVTVDLLGGQISWMFGTILPTLPQLKAGKLRALAVTSLARASVLPDVPAVAETLAGFEATSWYGLFAPAGTPPDIISKLQSEIVTMLAAPDIRDHLQREGAEPVGDTPEQFGRHFRGEIEKWAKVIRAAKITAE
jgi:tripartite-type tricarboxylate transporter receptor subunit TctC